MSPSRPFILRPVATTLLMVGILLVGFVAYRELPISALPQVDYPTIQVLTFYPGASPDVMTSSVTAPLERQFGQIPGLEPDDVDELVRELDHHAAVCARSQHRRGRAGSAGGDQCGVEFVAARSAESADLQQDQSGRLADSDAGADVGEPAAEQNRRSRRDNALAENFAVARRRHGQHQRRPEAGGADSGESDAACVVRIEP